MPTHYSPQESVPADYQRAGERAFQFFRHHSDDAYSSSTLMSMAAQAVNRLAPAIVIDEIPVEVDRRTETKRGGVRSCALMLADGRVLLATHKKHRNKGLGSEVLSYLNNYTPPPDGITMQLWVATRNIDGLRFLIGQGYEVIATGATTQCFAPPSYGEARSWPQ